jgi:hypothetical protein
VRKAGVADGEVNADCRAESGQSCDEYRLPQAPRQGTAIKAQEHRRAAAADAAAEAGPIVRDQRYEPRVNGFQLGGVQSDVVQILRHEDGRHSHARNDQTTDDQAQRRNQQQAASESFS